MGSKFVVLVVLAAVAQASLAAVDVKSAKKTTLAAWKNAAGIVYTTIESSSPDIAAAKAQYLAVGTPGIKTYIDATPSGGKGYEELLKDSAARVRKLDDLIFEGLTIANAATCKNLTETNTVLDNLLKQIPVEEGVKLLITLAESKASPEAGTAARWQAYTSYWAGIKSRAAVKAGIIKKVDSSSKAKALAGITEFVNIIYDYLPKQG